MNRCLLTLVFLIVSHVPVLRAGTGDDLVRRVEDAVARGERSIVVEKGDYVLDLPADRDAYFRLRRIRDVTIDFSGSRLWGRVKSRMFDLVCCTNVTLRNVTVDYPFSLLASNELSSYACIDWQLYLSVPDSVCSILSSFGKLYAAAPCRKIFPDFVPELLNSA